METQGCIKIDLIKAYQFICQLLFVKISKCQKILKNAHQMFPKIVIKFFPCSLASEKWGTNLYHPLQLANAMEIGRMTLHCKSWPLKNKNAIFTSFTMFCVFSTQTPSEVDKVLQVWQITCKSTVLAVYSQVKSKVRNFVFQVLNK